MLGTFLYNCQERKSSAFCTTAIKLAEKSTKYTIGVQQVFWVKTGYHIYKQQSIILRKRKISFINKLVRSEDYFILLCSILHIQLL